MRQILPHAEKAYLHVQRKFDGGELVAIADYRPRLETAEERRSYIAILELTEEARKLSLEQLTAHWRTGKLRDDKTLVVAHEIKRKTEAASGP